MIRRRPLNMDDVFYELAITELNDAIDFYELEIEELGERFR